MKTITREELKAKMDRGDDIVLLEALGEASYRRGHLPGAIRLQETGAAAEVVPDEEAFIVAHCSNFNGHSSTRVVRELTAMGYENAYEYEGGKEDWIEASYPVESEVPGTRRTLLDEYTEGIVPVRRRPPRSF